MSPPLQYTSLNEAWGIKKKATKKPATLHEATQEDIMRFGEPFMAQPQEPGIADIVASPPALTPTPAPAPAPALTAPVIDVILYVFSGILLIMMMEQILQAGMRLRRSA